MLAQYLDLTDQFRLLNTGDSITIDVSNYDYTIIQSVNALSPILISATLDGNAITGVSDGNATTAGNHVVYPNSFVYVQGKLSDGSIGSGLVGTQSIKYGVVGRYINIESGGSAPQVDKLLVMLSKIS
jgi:hypothetical protein